MSEASENNTTRPELASTQLSFTTADALVDLPNAPSHAYTILIFLRCRSGSNFSQLAYTDQVRHFLGVCKTGDPDFVILKKRQSACSNAITCQEEVPTNTVEFEEDFARDVSIDRKFNWVRFRVSVASSLKYHQLFKDDNYRTSKLIRKFRWYVELTSLDHDCYMVHIGWFKFLHPVFTNREDLRKDFNEYFKNIITEYDFTSRYERRTYTTIQGDGTEKKDSCKIRVISMYVPVDIAFTASRTILEFWGNELMAERNKHVDPNTSANRLLLSEFIPNSAKLLPAEDQIQHLLDQGQFLVDYKDAVIIHDCLSVDNEFVCSQTIATAANADQFQNKSTTLQKIMMSWVDNESQEKIIKSIEQMAYSRYAIVAHSGVLTEVRRVMYSLFQTLRNELGTEAFKTLGGGISDGMRVDDTKGLIQPERARTYLERLQHSNHYVKVGQRRYQQSPTKRSCVATNTNNSQVQRLYSDVLTPTPMNQIASTSKNTTSLVLSSKEGPNQQLSTLDDFNKLVQQQVEKIIAPSLTKLNSTINTVQQATSRVEQLERNTAQVQKKQEELSSTMTKSMTELTSIMQENLKIMRMETQSIQTKNNDQFSQLMQILQSNQTRSTVSTTPSDPSQLSSLTHSAASSAALSTSSQELLSTQPSQPSQSSPIKRKHSGSMLIDLDAEPDDDPMSVSPSFTDALAKHISQEEGSHKPSSSVSVQSPHHSRGEEVEGRRS